jgi:DNA-binding transcriptional ArsR family regulator
VADEDKKDEVQKDWARSDDDRTDEFKNLFKDLKNEIREEFKDIREEIEDLKHTPRKRPRRRPEMRPPRKRIKLHQADKDHWEDWGENIGSSLENYIGSVLESIWDSVDRSVGSLFQTSPRRRRQKRAKGEYISSIPDDKLDEFYKEGAELLSALSDQKRLQILKELEKEPMRQSDLSEKTNIKGGNFKHHMSILKEKGLVHQEGVRERYMLTFAGREALKLAEFLYHRAKRPKSVPIAIDEEETTLDSSEEE